ncbi:MAG: M15 family metallopeptidase [Flavobacteriaceae bacterium]
MGFTNKKIRISLIIILSGFFVVSAQQIPSDFKFVQDELPTIVIEQRYAGNHNFVGRPVVGYEGRGPILTQEACKALAKAQAYFNSRGFELKIFDGYRPQKAVNDFVQWSNDSSDTLMKSEFYPNLPKDKLFELGYIAEKSGHSRGSTIDLTLIHIETGQELDMGSPYDFFGKISGVNYEDLTVVQKKNRQLLQEGMISFGFQPYLEEWWHFTLKDEPFPDRYYDF